MHVGEHILSGDDSNQRVISWLQNWQVSQVHVSEVLKHTVQGVMGVRCVGVHNHVGSQVNEVIDMIVNNHFEAVLGLGILRVDISTELSVRQNIFLGSRCESSILISELSVHSALSSDLRVVL